MPSTRHHNEWLSLIEVSGPFLSVPVPERVFPHGLDVHDPEHARLLVQIYPANPNLEKSLHGRHWKATPATRMMELLHATDIRLGLVTNGNDWMLVDAPNGETTGFIAWDATYWSEEPLTLRAFRTLLGVHRFFSAASDQTLEAMLADSAKNQQEVTERLGYQVREAVEEIVRLLDRLDQDQGRALLAGIPETDLYEAALTVMMRLVFLFSAEERGLLLLGDPLYDEHYAVSTLVAKLQEAADQHGEEVLERRHDAGLLDHTAKRATEPILSLTAAKGDEPEVTLSVLEGYLEPQSHRAAEKTQEELKETITIPDSSLCLSVSVVPFLEKLTGRSESALMKASLVAKRVSPHTIRHTTATHLLRSGVDINTIRAWLGHVSLATTNVYAEVDLEMKAKALANCEVASNSSGKPWKEDEGLMNFLRTL